VADQLPPSNLPYAENWSIFGCVGTAKFLTCFSLGEKMD
jgi:hypothetical protein